MPETWPPDLPFFDRADGHSRTGPVGAIRRTPMDVGAKQRRVTTAAPRRYTGATKPLTLAQLGIFEAFFTETIADGALSFTATDQADGLTKTFRIVGGEYSLTTPDAGKRWTVSAELEIVAKPIRATVSIAARISGDPVQAFVGDTLYAVPAVYSGQPGTLSHEWYRVSTGAVVGTATSYTIRAADAFDEIGYRTRAVNGPSSAATPVSVDAIYPADVVVDGSGNPVVVGSSFVTPN